jgi:hypothetical protein
MLYVDAIALLARCALYLWHWKANEGCRGRGGIRQMKPGLCGVREGGMLEQRAGKAAHAQCADGTRQQSPVTSYFSVKTSLS